MFKYILIPRMSLWALTREKGIYRCPICESLNRYREPLNGAKEMDFCMKLPQAHYYKSANSKGSGETALMHRLAWAFAGRLSDNDHFLMGWLVKHKHWMNAMASGNSESANHNFSRQHFQIFFFFFIYFLFQEKHKAWHIKQTILMKNKVLISLKNNKRKKEENRMSSATIRLSAL